MAAEFKQLRDFTVKFFTEIGSNVQDGGDTISVTQVPIKFQKFYGKNEPYTIAFDKKYSSLSVEIITPESYLLKTIRSYLENTGESVLQKLKYSLQADSLIKEKIVLRNSAISKINTNISYIPIIKFTFQTSYKFLNDEEKIVTDVFIDDNKVVDIDLGNFSVESMKNKDFEIPLLRENYEIAKNFVREKIAPKTQEIAKNLEINLANDFKRIDEHHLQQVKEIDGQISRALAKNKSIDVSNLESQKKQFENEKTLQMQNEEKKYALKISTKLLTTAVIMRPIYNFEVFFKSADITRLVLMKFDPLYSKFTYPSCDNCKKDLSELILCNGNHLVCRDCGERCEDCGDISCVQCLRTKCAVTNRLICKKCGATCQKCKKFKNKRFMVQDSVGRYLFCRTC